MALIKRIKGFLTREDMEMLQEASKRKLKYPKIFTKSLKCTACDYKWFYNTAKCPACESTEIKL